MKGGKRGKKRPSAAARTEAAKKRRRSKTAGAQSPKPEGHWTDDLLERAVEGAFELTVRAAVKAINS